MVQSFSFENLLILKNVQITNLTEETFKVYLNFFRKSIWSKKQIITAIMQFL